MAKLTKERKTGRYSKWSNGPQLRHLKHPTNEQVPRSLRSCRDDKGGCQLPILGLFSRSDDGSGKQICVP
jgi:hypothetical protein